MVALSLLVLGDEETRARVQAAPAITIDGCKLACASKMVAESGGQVAYEANVLDTYRRNRSLRPKGIARAEHGRASSWREALAEELASAADESVRRGGSGRCLNCLRRKWASWPASGEERAEGTVTRLAALQSAGAAAPGRHGHHLPAALPGRRRGGPRLCPLLPDHCRGRLRQAVRGAGHGAVSAASRPPAWSSPSSARDGSPDLGTARRLNEAGGAGGQVAAAERWPPGG